MRILIVLFLMLYPTPKIFTQDTAIFEPNVPRVYESSAFKDSSVSSPVAAGSKSHPLSHRLARVINHTDTERPPIRTTNKTFGYVSKDEDPDYQIACLLYIVLTLDTKVKSTLVLK